VKTNTAPRSRLTQKTHEGLPVKSVDTMTELRRTASACLLFEGTFYENGVDVAKRMHDLVLRAPLLDVLKLAQDLRHENGLRHAPLWLLHAALYHPARHINSTQLEIVIGNVCGSRGDMAGELLAMYWKDGKRPLPKVLLRGLARAFISYSSHTLQKYASGGNIRLRDVLRLVHPKPRDEVQAGWFKLLTTDKITPPNTWESRLTSGEDKRAVFEDLLHTGQIGALAILRNLRNMFVAGVPQETAVQGLQKAVEKSRYKVLPFQFIAAMRSGLPVSMEPHIEKAMMQGIDQFVSTGVKLHGRTVILIDVSGSMKSQLSQRSTMLRSDAAAAMAMLLREVCDGVDIFDFDDQVQQVPPRRGFALRDAIRRPHGGTYTGKAVTHAMNVVTLRDGRPPDRVVIITDEQASAFGGPLPNLPDATRGYIMNVSTDRNGIARQKWITISGFSENLVPYIIEHEKQ